MELSAKNYAYRFKYKWLCDDYTKNKYNNNNTNMKFHFELFQLGLN